MAYRPGKRVMVVVLSVVALLAIFVFIAAQPGAKPDQLSQSHPAVNEPPLSPRRSAPSSVVSNRSEVNESAMLAPALDQPIVGKAVQFDVSKPLHDIPLPPIVITTTIREMTEPADTNGDVGPNDYVQMVNLYFQIFNKAGVSLYGPAPNITISGQNLLLNGITTAQLGGTPFVAGSINGTIHHLFLPLVLR